jgi:formylglycine-generating enzyme required for sulfatase activity
VREIELSDFEIGRYPVTVQEYGRFVNDEGYAKEEHWGAGGFGKFIEPGNWTDQRQYPNRPVVGVSWFEAMAYADWAKCVLPTEAQWERAARGPGRKYRKFPWGNKKPGKYMLNWAQCGLRMATPVGMFPDSDTEEGVADLAGNVLEWCRDAFDKNFYTKSPSKDPVNADYSVGVRVLRGGSWDYDFPDVFRCAFRLGIEPINRVIIIGFRVARSR